MKLKVLVLTDHTRHSAENSLYGLINAMWKHPQVETLDVATRNNPLNDRFFVDKYGQTIFSRTITSDFEFDEKGSVFFQNLKPTSIDDYDLILLRLPPPMDPTLVQFLKQAARRPIFVNDPEGMNIVGNKRFLLNLQDVCPPIQLLSSPQEIRAFSKQFPVVLKPLNNYGGQGVLRVEQDVVYSADEEMSLSDFLEKHENESVEYLGMQFLKRVTAGDKRILVVDGKVMGASLRLPKTGAWLCNVSQGGQSVQADLTAEELAIVEKINPTLEAHGVVMYGMDTLENDEGKRVLSELNTTSIGGIKQIEMFTGQPVLKETIDRIINYAIRKKIGKQHITT